MSWDVYSVYSQIAKKTAKELSMEEKEIHSREEMLSYIGQDNADYHYFETIRKMQNFRVKRKENFSIIEYDTIYRSTYNSVHNLLFLEDGKTFIQIQKRAGTAHARLSIDGLDVCRENPSFFTCDLVDIFLEGEAYCQFKSAKINSILILEKYHAGTSPHVSNQFSKYTENTPLAIEYNMKEQPIFAFFVPSPTPLGATRQEEKMTANQYFRSIQKELLKPLSILQERIDSNQFHLNLESYVKTK